jgi:glycosyltransferase involved in cell wall biosynthesis
MSNQITPYFSLIIPIYNLELFLEDCLSSILSQTFENFEIILINDGSVDNSFEICNFYKKKDKRVFVYNLENEGVSKARNLGIDYAKGKYIWFIDGDDWIESEALLKLYKLTENNSVDIFSFFYNVFDNENNSFIMPFKIPREIEINSGYNLLDKYLKPNSWSYIFKSEYLLINKLKFKNISVGEDEMFVWDAIILAKNVRQSVDKLYNYRIRNNSTITGPVTTIKIKSRIRMIKYFNLIQNKYELDTSNNIEKYTLNIFYELIRSNFKYNVSMIFLKLIKTHTPKLYYNSSDSKAILTTKYIYNFNIYLAYFLNKFFHKVRTSCK